MAAQKYIENLVIGAGISGLGAAYTLHKAGKKVAVIEESDKTGGRAKTRHYEGISFDTGAQFILSTYKKTIALAQELGLSVISLPINTITIVNGKNRSTINPSSKKSYVMYNGLTALSKLKFATGLTKHFIQYSKHNLYKLDQLKPLDKTTLEEFAKKSYGSEALNSLVNPVVSSLFFHTAENTSAALWLGGLSMLNNATPMTIEGGMGTLPVTLASKVPVLYRTRATEITRQDKYYKVTIENLLTKTIDEILASNVIITVPSGQAAQILNIEGLQVDFLNNIEYSRTIGLFCTGNTDVFSQTYAYWFTPQSEDRIISLSKNPYYYHKPNERFNAAFTIYLTYKYASKLFDQNSLSENVISTLLSETVGSVNNLKIHHIQSRNHAIPMFKKGHISDVITFKERINKIPNLYMCGDYLSGPSIETVLADGIIQAENILKASA